MGRKVLALTDDAISELLLGLASRPLIDVLLLYVHRLLMQLELLLVCTHPVEELGITRTQLRVEVFALTHQHDQHLNDNYDYKWGDKCSVTQ